MGMFIFLFSAFLLVSLIVVAAQKDFESNPPLVFAGVLAIILLILGIFVDNALAPSQEDLRIIRNDRVFQLVAGRSVLSQVSVDNAKPEWFINAQAGADTLGLPLSIDRDTYPLWRRATSPGKTND